MIKSSSKVYFLRNLFLANQNTVKSTHFFIYNTNKCLQSRYFFSTFLGSNQDKIDKKKEKNINKQSICVDGKFVTIDNNMFCWLKIVLQLNVLRQNRHLVSDVTIGIKFCINTLLYDNNCVYESLSLALCVYHITHIYVLLQNHLLLLLLLLLQSRYVHFALVCS